jgi:hypothetical protein
VFLRRGPQAPLEEAYLLLPAAAPVSAEALATLLVQTRQAADAATVLEWLRLGALAYEAARQKVLSEPSQRKPADRGSKAVALRDSEAQAAAASALAPDLSGTGAGSSFALVTASAAPTVRGSAASLAQELTSTVTHADLLLPNIFAASASARAAASASADECSPAACVSKRLEKVRLLRETHRLTTETVPELDSIALAVVKKRALLEHGAQCSPFVDLPHKTVVVALPFFGMPESGPPAEAK